MWAPTERGDIMSKLALQVKTTGEVIELDLSSDSLETLQKAVGGWVQAVDLDSDLSLWCNEEGKMNGLPHNTIAQSFWDKAFGEHTDYIVGDIVLTGGTDSEGDLIGLTHEQIEQVLAEVRHLNRKSNRWQDHLGDAPMTEDNVWQAIADANNLDYSEIADGDILEWL